MLALGTTRWLWKNSLAFGLPASPFKAACFLKTGTD
jgi:hypothetical protein